jgi:predicted permease
MMRVWHIVASRGRSLFRRGRREDDLREELQLHLEREAERLQADGLSPQDAMAEARRRFGGVEWTKELCRDARGTTRLEIVLRDVRYAARRLARDWRFTAAAVLILGLGIGANTAIFSLVDATLFRRATLADADRLVDLYQVDSNPSGIDGNSYPAYQDMAAYTDVFAETTAALVPVGVSYLDGGTLRSAVVEHVTPSYPTVLGLRPTLGRWFDAAEDRPGVAAVAVIGHDAWRRRFDADPAIIGRTLQIEGAPVTIVGVGPKGHRATIDIGLVTDFWMPVHAVKADGVSADLLARKPEEAAFSVKARLRDGVTVAQAQAAMRILGRRLAAEYPTEDPGKGISVVASNDVRIHPQLDGLLTAVATVLQAIVGLVLAIAGSNLATLLLVRGTARAKEVSVRLALGASRGQLIRHLLTESLLLSLAGCVAGCVLAWWAVRTLAAIELPIIVDLSLDVRVLAFAAAISVVTGVAFGLAPALKATRVDLVPTLRGDGDARSPDRRRWTLKDALVMFQVAVSVLLLGSTSVFLRMLQASRAPQAGFAVDGVALLETDARYAMTDAAKPGAAFDAVARRIAARPGVQAVAVAHGLPMQSTGRRVFLGDAAPSATALEGAAGIAGVVWAGPGYLEALRIPIRFGRSLDERDRPDTPRVAVVSETMARQFFRVANPADAIGRRFRLEKEAGGMAMEIVGIAADTGTADRQEDLVEPRPQMIYRSYVQAGLRPTVVLARTGLDAATLIGEMRHDLRAVDPSLPVVSAMTMTQYLESSLAAPKAVATFIGGLGVLGLVLAAVGLYAVISFAVSRRAREIGIRMALGAHRGQAVWTVARGVAILVGIGTAVGVGLTVLAITGLRAAAAPAPGITLYRPSVDPLGLLLVALFVSAVAAVAAIGPARRAASMDPLVALRRD